MVENTGKQIIRRRNTTQIIAALVIFASGIIVGSGATIYTLKAKGILRPMTPPSAAEIADRIGKDHKLTKEQILEVEKIFEDAGNYLEEIRTDFDNKIEAKKDIIIKEMQAVLPPDKFEEWQEHFNSHHNKRHPAPMP